MEEKAFNVFNAPTNGFKNVWTIFCKFYMTLTYDAFRAEFARKAESMMFYPVIHVAESYPQYVKHTYRFLSDEKTPMQEKIKMLKVVREIGHDAETTLSYIFEPTTDGKPIIKSPGDVAKEVAAYMAAAVLEAEKLVKEAKDAGLNIKPEEEVLSIYRETANIAGISSQIIEALQNALDSISGEISGPVQ